jgi:protein involved in sex pheromone biosynthesis
LKEKQMAILLLAIMLSVVFISGCTMGGDEGDSDDDDMDTDDSYQGGFLSMTAAQVSDEYQGFQSIDIS